MENVKQGTEKMKADFKNVLEQIQDTDNIDDFHSVGIGRFKITQVRINKSKRFLSTKLIKIVSISRLA